MTINTFKLITKNITEVGTFGTLTDPDGDFVCYTAEREWLNNQQSISCVPAGSYCLVWKDSPKFGNRLHLSSVDLGVTVNGPSQRTHCLFHAANAPSEVAGCIAPGMNYGVVNGEWAVTGSAEALREVEFAVSTRTTPSLMPYLEIIRF